MELKLNEYIEVNAGVRSGKPCITGSRITVSDVAIMYLRMGQSLEEIAATYELPLAAVFAAMAFYYDNQDEIDRRIAEAEAFAEAERQKQPSLLAEKLNAMRTNV